MSTVKYIKSFSKGQITIPKEFRDFFGMTDEFWLKLWIEKGKLIAEPIIHEQKTHPADYQQKLKNITITIDLTPELKKSRGEIKKRLANNAL